MSQIALINEASDGTGRIPPPRTWAGTLAKAGEVATHYLHLRAFPCEKCKGPVIAGWIGRREDDITSETETSGIGAVCLVCGWRPEVLNEPLQSRYFRPVEWEWSVGNQPAVFDPNGDPLSAELSQDADCPGSTKFAAESQP
jgi:hypothetical protein